MQSVKSLNCSNYETTDSSTESNFLEQGSKAGMERFQRLWTAEGVMETDTQYVALTKFIFIQCLT